MTPFTKARLAKPAMTATTPATTKTSHNSATHKFNFLCSQWTIARHLSSSCRLSIRLVLGPNKSATPPLYELLLLVCMHGCVCVCVCMDRGMCFILYLCLCKCLLMLHLKLKSGAFFGSFTLEVHRFRLECFCELSIKQIWHFASEIC